MQGKEDGENYGFRDGCFLFTCVNRKQGTGAGQDPRVKLARLSLALSYLF